MIAPALVATTMPAGTHRVAFRYRGFRGYALLFAISAATLLSLLCMDVVRGGSSRRRSSSSRLLPFDGAARPAA
jgi:hypothetical protein